MSRPTLDAAAHPPAAPARPLRVLVVDAESDQVAHLGASLAGAVPGEVELVGHRTLDAARSDLRSGDFDCVLLDVSGPYVNPLESLAEVRRLAPEAPVVVLSDPEREEVAVQAVHEGAQDYLVGRVDGGLLARSIRYAIERMQSQLELARLAFYDPLTQLPNRKLLVDRLGLALAAAERSGRLAALLFLDLDRFKLVNESLGHDVGDGLLREVATRLTELVRPGDTVARLGGDEFMLLCPDLRDEREAVLIAERLSGGLAEALVVDGLELYVGASIGIAFGHGRRSPEALIRDADQTMYRAKERGTRYELFEPGGTRRPGRRLGLETELRHALEREELRLVYQPELDCGFDRIFGVEALLRWRHPHRGVVAPGEFISLAEETGLIVPIGEWVIVEATRQLAEWRRAEVCAPDLTMSVNVSPRQLVDEGLPAAVRSALDASDLPSERLCLEVTESTVAADPVRVLRRLEELLDLGVSLSLDDFGTGLSSLSVLSGYPVDTLKVDRSFITRLSEGLKHRRLLASVVGVAHALGIRALAEGVETRAQLEEVYEAGCDAAQGFFVGRPVAASDLVARLRGAPLLFAG